MMVLHTRRRQSGGRRQIDLAAAAAAVCRVVRYEGEDDGVAAALKYIG